LGINDCLLLVVALFFGYLLLAVHYEGKRATDRRKRDLGPPDGIERRSGRDRRQNSHLKYMAWVCHSRLRRLGGSKKDQPAG
jgi:hypothetical protein